MSDGLEPITNGDDMKPIKRRTALARLAAWPVLGLLAPSALAQGPTFPVRPVRLIVPYGPGTVSDASARLLAERLAEAWGVGVVVENLTGAGGVVGAQAIAKAAPDGYTLGMLASNHAMNAALYGNLPFDAVKDFQPLLHTTYNQFAFCVHPSVPAQTLRELMALAKAKPDFVTYSSSGNGGSPHLAMAKLAYMAGVQMLHVPYKTNGAGVTDLLSGQVMAMSTSVSVLAPHVNSGKLRALAVSGNARSPLLPNVPTASEAGVTGYTMTNWNGIVAPAGLPAPLADRLVADMARVMKDPRTLEKVAALGAEVELLAADDFERKLRQEIVSWTQVVKATGVKAD
ncbi:tripartite tricarboxylate transporter substrate binding protein [Ramlibacter sp. AN1015]|uniref:Bug family tripartite tricarboxylate transporter substrate binding protein n=1 Tax=Ramlibacter sp. AN1015 TaxID=3133428 RepID=UPI0030BF018F